MRDDEGDIIKLSIFLFGLQHVQIEKPMTNPFSLCGGLIQPRAVRGLKSLKRQKQFRTVVPSGGSQLGSLLFCDVTRATLIKDSVLEALVHKIEGLPPMHLSLRDLLDPSLALMYFIHFAFRCADGRRRPPCRRWRAQWRSTRRITLRDYDSRAC